MNRAIIYLSTVLAATSLSAETLTPAQALARVNTESTSVRKIASRAAAEAVPARTITIGNAPGLYVFTPADGGLLLVSAESETPALIGYTDNYSAGNELPPALESMMRCWAAEIEAQRAGNVIYGSTSRADEDFAPIDPICKTRWNQDAPYNGKCPQLLGADTYTGCVATAVAQVLKVYEYPARCSGGKHSYKWAIGNKTLTLNFDDVVLDWDNMLDTYTASATQAQKDAVATLMQALGYTSDMQYSTAGSGTTSISMIAGLARNFDYDLETLEYSYRSTYTLAQWQQKVYDVLATGYPVYYDGVTTDAEPLGHAFVVDGYRSEGYFHLNWGWGGMSDGYFLLTALDPDAQGIGGAYPSAGFDYVQGAIFGLQKGNDTSSANAPLRFYSDGGLRTDATSATLGKTVQFYYPEYFINIGAVSANPVPAITLTAANGKTYTVRAGGGMGTLKPGFGFRGAYYSVIIPSDLPDGEYTIHPSAYNSNSQKYYDVSCPIGYGGEIKASVGNSTITFHAPAIADIKAADISLPEQIFTNKAFEISGTIKALNTESYYGKITACLYAPGETKERATLGCFMVSVDAGKSVPFYGTLKLTTLAVTSGEYELALVDDFGNAISDRINIEVTAPDDAGALKASGLKCLNPAKNDLKFEVTLAASEGKFNGQVYIELHVRGNYDSYEILLPSETVEIADGTSKTVTITGAFPDGIPGTIYTAYVCYTRLGEWTEATGRQRLNFTLGEESGINEVSNGQPDAACEYYDLFGRRVLNPSRGVYIKSDGTKVIL